MSAALENKCGTDSVTNFVVMFLEEILLIITLLTTMRSLLGSPDASDDFC